MRTALILNKLNFKDENYKNCTLELINYLSSFTNLEIYLAKDTNTENYLFVSHNLNEKLIHKITALTIFQIYFKFDFIFSSSSHNPILKQLARLPKRIINIKVNLDEIEDIEEIAYSANKFDLSVSIKDVFLNLSLLKKIMKTKISTQKFKRV